MREIQDFVFCLRQMLLWMTLIPLLLMKTTRQTLWHIFLILKATLSRTSLQNSKTKGLLDLILLDLHEDRFRQNVRMSRNAFEHIANLIKEHRIFHYKSRHVQAHPQIQLIAALFCFGCNGNGSSVAAVAQKCGIRKGTLDSYTNR